MPDHERLRDALRESQHEPRVKRMWDRIDEARAPRARARSGRRAARVVSAGILAAAAAIALVFLAPQRVPEPLTLEGSAPLAGSLAPDRTVRLSDGSQIAVDADARLDVLESSARTVALALRQGRARFEVTPRGPRAWRIDCGGVTVEVVGTVFTIDRDGAHVAVSVERGSVLVRGDDVPDHVQRLEAGDVLEVGAPSIAPPLREENAETTADESIAPVPSTQVSVAPPGGGDRRSASAPSRATDDDPVAALLARADAARRRGEDADAARVLEVVVAEHAEDQRAALAAYSLARLRLDRMGEPGAAARDFERALALGLPDQLAEGAHAGRAIALARQDDPAAASAVADYLEAYPEGRYRAEVLRWQGEH